MLEQLSYYNKKFQTNNLNFDDVLLNLNESLSVFANEILIKEKRGTSIQDFLGLPWDNKEEIVKYIADKDLFKDEWTLLYPEIKSLMNKVDENTVELVFKSTQSFILNTIYEMKNKLPFNHKIIKASYDIFFHSTIFNRDSWQILADQFKNIISEGENRSFQNELKRMACNHERHAKEHRESQRTILETWSFLSNQYPSMGKLAKSIIALTHSSCPVERIFAQMEDFVTPKRNRMTSENLEACLLIHQAQEFDGYDFEINNDMFENLPKFKKKR